jgi:hypothetical protein
VSESAGSGVKASLGVLWAGILLVQNREIFVKIK